MLRHRKTLCDRIGGKGEREAAIRGKRGEGIAMAEGQQTLVTL